LQMASPERSANLVNLSCAGISSQSPWGVARRVQGKP
jgi:hypothetical protein